MKAIKLDVKLFGRNKRYREWSKKVLGHMLTALFEIDKDYLDAFPNTISLYRSGIIYCQEDGTEDWQPIPNAIQTGVADCEDLACWRAAELVVNKGILAFPVLREKTSRDKIMYHVLVQYPNGSLEDPSKRLGMNNPRVERLCNQWV